MSHFNLGNFDNNKAAEHKEVKAKTCFLQKSTLFFLSYYAKEIVF